jgi:hypothetical protein
MCSTQPTFNHIIGYKDAMTVCHCVKYRYENWRQCSGNVMSFLTTFTLVNNENLICTYDALMIESWRSIFMTWVLFCFVTNYMNKLFKISKQERIKWVKIRCVVNFLSFFGGKSFWVRNESKSQHIHFMENLLYYIILMSHKGKLLKQGCVCESNIRDSDITQKHKLV